MAYARRSRLVSRLASRLRSRPMRRGTIGRIFRRRVPMVRRRMIRRRY